MLGGVCYRFWREKLIKLEAMARRKNRLCTAAADIICGILMNRRRRRTKKDKAPLDKAMDLAKGQIWRLL